MNEDVFNISIRKFLKKKLFHAGISRVNIERAASKAKVYVHAAKPGIIIGKRGAGVDGQEEGGKEDEQRHRVRDRRRRRPKVKQDDDGGGRVEGHGHSAVHTVLMAAVLVFHQRRMGRIDQIDATQHLYM